MIISNILEWAREERKKLKWLTENSCSTSLSFRNHNTHQNSDGMCKFEVWLITCQLLGPTWVLGPLTFLCPPSQLSQKTWAKFNTSTLSFFFKSKYQWMVGTLAGTKIPSSHRSGAKSCMLSRKQPSKTMVLSYRHALALGIDNPSPK